MTTERARKLRRTATDAEARLWSCLRRNLLDGHHFRRQVPVGPYIVDFICAAKQLVVEVDGGQHAARRAEDAVRTTFLRERGYRVIRFWNNDVLGDTEAVLEATRHVLRDE